VLVGAFFAALNAQGQVIGKGQVVGIIGKSEDRFVLQFHTKPAQRRILGLAALENFAFFGSVDDLKAFLTPPEPPPSRPEPQAPAAGKVRPAETGQDAAPAEANPDKAPDAEHHPV
jgi:hypothetical protein